MYFTVTNKDKSFLFQSDSADLAALKTELTDETVGIITSDGTYLVGIYFIKEGIISLAPSPPNEPVILP